jgi:hypothetical protein
MSLCSAGEALLVHDVPSAVPDAPVEPPAPVGDERSTAETDDPALDARTLAQLEDILADELAREAPGQEENMSAAAAQLLRQGRRYVEGLPPWRDNRLVFPRHVFWVNTPMCESSFFDSLLRLACARHLPNSTALGTVDVSWVEKGVTDGCGPVFQNAWFHDPWRPALNSKVMGRIVFTVLRNPLYRVIFAYHSYLHGASKETMEKLDGIDRRENLSEHLWVFASAPEQLGMQARMLIGRPYTECQFSIDKCNMSARDVEDSIEVLKRDAKFVGITDEWELSVTLLHAMFRRLSAGSSFPVKWEFGHARQFERGSSRLREAGSILASRGWRDPYDTPLFLEGRSIFYSHVAKYIKPLCARLRVRTRGKGADTNRMCRLSAQPRQESELGNPARVGPWPMALP